MSKASPFPVDVIYVTVCSLDARLARICLASIRYFYPDVPIRILPGGPLQRGFASELKEHWNIDVVDIPGGNYGWGYVKLEPLFGPRGQRFMVCDSDTIFTGRVLDTLENGDAPFLIDYEEMTDSEARRLYFDWDRIRSLDPDAPTARGAFNSGQWFGTAGVVDRAAFDPWLEWTMPRRQRHPDQFMGGEQGILNYVLLKKEAREGLQIKRTDLMRWPGHGIEDMTLADVLNGTAPARVVHWAGMKSILLRNMLGGALLQYFEDHYYSRMPLGQIRRRINLWRHVWSNWSHRMFTPYRLFIGKWWRRYFPSSPSTAVVIRGIAS